MEDYYVLEDLVLQEYCMFDDLNFLIWDKNFQLAEVRMEEFVLVGNFPQEYFVLNNLTFMEWEINY